MENRKNLYMVVADNIKRERRRLQLTQMELADRADISVDTVKSIERGRRSMSLDTYLGIVQALETSPSALVNGKQPGKYMERFRYIVDQRSESEIEFVPQNHKRWKIHYKRHDSRNQNIRILVLTGNFTQTV